MRGAPPPLNVARRYWKFGWNSINDLPPIGKIDYQPQNGAFYMFSEGKFIGKHQYNFSAKKRNHKLPPLGFCAYCFRKNDTDGKFLSLTSEHIIPEFLGAGLEIPESSCKDCQKITSKFEASIAQEIFDPVRKSFSLVGKNGVLQKTNFPLDIGRETNEKIMIPLTHYPTVLVLPYLFPASSYSNRPKNADDPFKFCMYNINADPRALKKYEIDKISSQMIDMIRFAQIIAKIAHISALNYLGYVGFLPLVANFIRTDFEQKNEYNPNHLEHIGCLWNQKETKSKNLHEIEFGEIEWNKSIFLTVRVRLFASYDMPSYYVTIGLPAAQ